MKKVFSTLLAAGFIALVACGPAEEKKDEGTNNDSTAVEAPAQPEAAPATTGDSATTAAPVDSTKK